MAVPRNRVSNSRKNTRRSHMAKKPKQTSGCPNCGVARLPHMMCVACGHYAGRAIVSVAENQ